MSNNIHRAPSPAQVLATIYFGAYINGEYGVKDTQFAAFLADEVTPDFPGFTLQECEGYWKGKPEVVRVLTILSMDGDHFRYAIKTIAERYKARFFQEAVAYSFTPTEFSLDCWPYGNGVRAYHKPGLGY